MKYQFMQQHAQQFSIKKMAKVLNISRSGYYQFITAKPSERAKENQRLFNAIKTLHDNSRQTYASPRIWAELRANGERCSRKRVCKLMKVAGLQKPLQHLMYCSKILLQQRQISAGSLI